MPAELAWTHAHTSLILQPAYITLYNLYISFCIIFVLLH